jgi:hypothetical protein
VRRLPPDGKTLALSASIVKRLFRSGVRSRNQVALMSHSVDAYECAQLPALSLILPDDTPLPSDLNKSPKADRHNLLPDRVEKLRVHGFVAPAFFAADLRPHFVDRDVADHLAQLLRFVEPSDVAMPAPDACYLPGVVGMQ